MNPGQIRVHNFKSLSRSFDLDTSCKFQVCVVLMRYSLCALGMASVYYVRIVRMKCGLSRFQFITLNPEKISSFKFEALIDRILLI